MSEYDNIHSFVFFSLLIKEHLLEQTTARLLGNMNLSKTTFGLPPSTIGQTFVNDDVEQDLLMFFLFLLLVIVKQHERLMIMMMKSKTRITLAVEIILLVIKQKIFPIMTVTRLIILTNKKTRIKITQCFSSFIWFQQGLNLMYRISMMIINNESLRKTNNICTEKKKKVRTTVDIYRNDNSSRQDWSIVTHIKSVFDNNFINNRGKEGKKTTILTMNNVVPNNNKASSRSLEENIKGVYTTRRILTNADNSSLPFF